MVVEAHFMGDMTERFVGVNQQLTGTSQAIANQETRWCLFKHGSKAALELTDREARDLG